MYWVSAYWVFGCLLVGMAIGDHDKKCPNDPSVPPQTVIISVATWPVGFGVWLTGPKYPASLCKVGAAQ